MEKVNVNIESNIEIELKEKVFARICQILDENGKENLLINKKFKDKSINIPFEFYDKNFMDLERNFFNTKLNIDFFSDDIKEKIINLMILEYYVKQSNLGLQVDKIEDIINAVINPQKCKGKILTITERGECVQYNLSF